MPDSDDASEGDTLSSSDDHNYKGCVRATVGCETSHSSDALVGMERPLSLNSLAWPGDFFFQIMDGEKLLEKCR